MKKTRKLAAAACCGILVIFGMQSQAAAQEKLELPKDLGQNKGTGDPVKRVGSWDLVRIKTTAKGFDLPGKTFPRETKDLPVDTRERSGINWIGKGMKIGATVVFLDLKKTVGGNNAGASDPSLKVLVKADVMKVEEDRAKNDFVAMRCIFDFTSPSGKKYPQISDYSARQHKIVPGYYPASKKEEFTCGGDLRPSLKPGEDFTLNYQLQVYNIPNDPVDVTYHFFYEWARWQSESRPEIPNSDLSLNSVSSLSSLIALLNSLSGDAQKLSSTYADISMIADTWASKAGQVNGQKMKVASDWAVHKAWAAEKGQKAALAHLQQKVSGTFKLLNRSQQNAFSTEVSAALASGAEKPVTGPSLGNIPAVGGTVTGLKLFENESDDLPAVGLRPYKESFAKVTVKAIYYEFSVKYVVDSATVFAMSAIWKKNSEVLTRQELSVAKPSGFNTSSKTHGFIPPTGRWDPGTYTLDIEVDGRKVASAPFTVK